MSTNRIVIRISEEREHVTVKVTGDDFGAFMCAAEYLNYLVATKSNLGFEKAMELIAKGSLEWRSSPSGPRGITTRRRTCPPAEEQADE